MKELKTRKEIKEERENSFKDIEDFYKWFHYTSKDYPFLIEPYPHRPFYLKEEKWEILPEYRKKFSYTFFPWREEIPLGDIILKDGNLLAPWVTEDNIEIFHGISSGDPRHYSTDERVWRWDFDRGIEESYYKFPSSSSIEYSLPLKQRTIDLLREYGIHYTVIKDTPDRKGYIFLRLGWDGYKKFRRMLLDISEKYKIRSYYSYEEIRDFIYDSPSSIIA